ncbi:hypothetical protein AB6A40_004870 [Gnathostoma spinigerum]|uniref:Nuclear condensin complex subunit 3 C-terminal domain-containing protein n=1 Tax=Gnathostoma spinigerum TaxID=75299 RepID=A0ABD6EL70_9BILA
MRLDLTTEIVNLIVQQLFLIAWPKPEDNLTALSEFCDLTSFIVDHAVAPNATILQANQTISIGISKDLSTLDLNEIDDDVLRRCTMVISAMLKTNRFKKMHTLLRGLLENIIEKAALCSDTECRILAFEAMGIMAMYDTRLAVEKIIFIKKAVELDETLKSVSLVILCNMILLHGYEAVAKWYSCDNQNPSDRKALIQVMSSFINDENLDVSFTACECLCKLFLSSDAKAEWRDELCQIILKVFDPTTAENQKQKAMLSAFLPFFAETSRNNQCLLASIFLDIFDILRSATEGESLALVDPNIVASCLAYATSFQALTGAGRESGSVHPDLCGYILSGIISDPEDEFIAVFTKTLFLLDVSEWRDVAQIRELLKLTNTARRGAHSNARCVRLLSSFATLLKKRITELLSFDDEDVLSERTSTLSLSAEEFQTKLRLSPDVTKTAKKGASSVRKRPPAHPRLTNLDMLNELLKQNESGLEKNKVLPPTTPYIASVHRRQLSRSAKSAYTTVPFHLDANMEEEDDSSS